MKKLLFGICIAIGSCTIMNAQSVTIAGKVKSYKSKTNACFFVDKDMVQQGITTGLGNKVGNTCTDLKYGKGVSISFSGLKKDADYSYAPSENVLISVQGYWKSNPDQSYTFHVTEWEPFL